MAKGKIIKKTIRIPIWERDLIAIIGGDFGYILKVAKENNLSKRTIDEIIIDKASIGNVDGCAYFCEESGTAILYFPTKSVRPEIIVHEVTHIVDELMIFLNAIKEHEARAHTTEWLFLRITEILKSFGS